MASQTNHAAKLIARLQQQAAQQSKPKSGGPKPNSLRFMQQQHVSIKKP